MSANNSLATSARHDMALATIGGFAAISDDQLADVAGGLSVARVAQVAKFAFVGATYAAGSGAAAGAAIGAFGGGIGALPGALMGAGVGAITGAFVGGMAGAQLPIAR
jgi:hypothetical protein